MKCSIIAIALLFGASASTFAATRQDNYRDCGLKQLARCDDTNELFFGPFDKTGHSKAKTEFPQAIHRFLAGAPKLYTGKFGFTAANVVRESLVGPGTHHDRLPEGDWFFDGFDTYYGPDRGAAIFDASGKILALALLDGNTDEPAKVRLAAFELRIYSHGELAPVLLAKLQEWGRSSVDPKSLYPGALPPNVLVDMRLYVLAGGHWTMRPLP